jgi:hypothetical protein
MKPDASTFHFAVVKEITDMYTLKAALAAIVMLPALLTVCLWAEITGSDTVGFVS